MSKRPVIQTDDVGLMDERSQILHPGFDADDMAVVTEDSMRSKGIQEYAQELAFMEEMVTFQIGDPGYENAPEVIECAVNGEKRKFYRNREYTEKRKFLNALINVCWKTETKIKKGDDNMDATHVVNVPYQAHNISIIQDPSPLGSKWLEYKRNGDRHVKRAA